jgi:hypothetical protein
MWTEGRQDDRMTPSVSINQPNLNFPFVNSRARRSRKAGNAHMAV